MADDRKRSVTKPYIIFTVVMFLLLIFPLFGVANRVFPLMLGMPFGLFWVVLLEALAFVALCGFYVYEYGKGSRA